MSDYPMLISNKLHSFRNFTGTKIHDLLKFNHIHIQILQIKQKSFIACCATNDFYKFPFYILFFLFTM